MELTILQIELIQTWFFFSITMIVLFIMLWFFAIKDPDDKKDPCKRGIFWIIVTCMVCVLICGISTDYYLRNYKYKDGVYHYWCPRCGHLHKYDDAE